MGEGSAWISLLPSVLIHPPPESTWGNPPMTTMVEVTEVVEAIVVAHHHLIIVDDAMSGHGLVHTLLVMMKQEVLDEV